MFFRWYHPIRRGGNQGLRKARIGDNRIEIGKIDNKYANNDKKGVSKFFEFVQDRMHPEQL